MPSILEDYARNYGSKLASALNGGMQSLQPQPPQTGPISQEPGGEGPFVGEGPPESGYEPGSADPDPIRRISTGGGSPLAGGQEEQEEGSALGETPTQGGVTFRDTFKKAPASVQNQQLTKLEKALAQGNQTIDSAYDDLVKQLGAPPDRNRKLGRKEKGMLLMEFGLSMLANSRKGLATAAGQAGGETLGTYAQMKNAPADQYAANRSAIEASRAKDKTALARASALEGMKSPSAGSLPGKFVGDDGYVYFYDQNGQVQQAKDQNGKAIKGQAGANGSDRGFESDAKYKKYMEIYGVDPNTGQPLTGLALQRAKQDALEFANDRGASVDDVDLDLQSEKSADDFIRSNNDLFRDMTPDQVNEKRNQIADERRRRLRKKPSSYLSPNEPTRGRKTGRSFASEADAQAALERGDIRSGDQVTIGGRPATVD